MKTILINENVAFTKVRSPESFFERAIGLLGRSMLEESEAMWFENCSFIHMFGMRMPIDLIFLDHDNRVLKVVEGLKPWRISLSIKAKKAVEVKSGICEKLGVSLNDQFKLCS